MIDSSKLFIPLRPSPCPPVSLNGTLSCTWQALTGSECVCLLVCVWRVQWWWGSILEIKPLSPMVDCPTIDTNSVALKGSLRHQWINSYYYASIYHPPFHPSPLADPPPLHSLTLNFPGIWAQTPKPLLPPSWRCRHISRKKVFAFMLANVCDS